jgi:hypothetical protein
MSDITYAEVEIVRFMKPKIRTRHQRPKNKLTRTPFDRCRSWYAEVEMFVQGGERREGVDTLNLHISTWRGLGFLKGEAKLEVLRC